MSNWLASIIDRAEQGGSAALAESRAAALQALQGKKLPTRKNEDWKYTSLYALEKSVFNAAVQSDKPLFDIAGLVSLELKLCGDAWSLPEQLPEGLTISLASKHDLSGAAQASLGKIKPQKHFFGLINDAVAADVVVIDVADNAKIDQPVRISLAAELGAEQYGRVLVRLGQGSQLSVVEQLMGDTAGASNLFIEYDIGAESKLIHYRLALQTGKHFSLGGCHFRLGEKSNLDSHIVAFGSEISRLDVDIEHAGSFAFAKMNAVYLLDGEEHFDLHSCIEHAVPNGTSEENVRGIVADHSQAVFNGRIHIHRDAQKTLAELNNRNLMLSRNAEINTKPELEIYADDVRCAHGATIAEIDTKAMYYLRSRGISQADAQVMLNFGFINELVDQMPHEPIAEYLRPLLKQRFASMKVQQV